MGSTTIAVDTLDRLAVQLEGIQEAAQQLRDIGSFQDAIADLTTQRDRLLAEVGALKTKQAEVLQTHLKAVDTAKQEVRAASDHAEKLVRDAKIHAQAILTEAAEQAALDLQADKANRETVLKEIKGKVAAEQRKLDELIETASKAGREAEAIERRAAAAQEALEKIQAQARALTGQ